MVSCSFTRGSPPITLSTPQVENISGSFPLFPDYEWKSFHLVFNFTGIYRYNPRCININGEIKNTEDWRNHRFLCRSNVPQYVDASHPIPARVFKRVLHWFTVVLPLTWYMWVTRDRSNWSNRGWYNSTVWLKHHPIFPLQPFLASSYQHDGVWHFTLMTISDLLLN